VFFPENAEPASLILAEFSNDIDAAIKCVESIGDYMKKNGLSWTLRTVLRRVPEYRRMLAKGAK